MSLLMWFYAKSALFREFYDAIDWNTVIVIGLVMLAISISL
jgi:hypothetical protein